MAKSKMALGQYRGKMGGLVFRKGENGQQIISAYQPIVKNPRTDGQLMIRSKFNLAVQIAKQIPVEVSFSLGNTNRARRAAIISNISKAATAVKNGNDYVASVNGNKVILTKGANASPMAPTASFDNSNQTIEIRWQDIDGMMGWSGSDKVSAVIGIFSNDGSLPPVFIPVLDAADMSTRTASYAAPTNMTGAGFKAMVWVFVTRAKTSGVSSVSGTDASVPNNDISASLSLGTGLNTLEYSDSIFAGVFPME